MRTKRRSSPVVQVKPKRKKTNHLPDGKRIQQSKRLNNRPEFHLTTEVLQTLNSSNNIPRPRIKGKIQLKLQDASDYLTTCRPEELHEIRQIASQGGFDLSGLKTALRDGTHSYVFIGHPAEDGGYLSNYREDEAMDGDDENGDDDDDNEEKKEESEVVQLVEWAVKRANRCNVEHSADTSDGGRRSAVKPRSPSPSLGGPRPPMYFPEPPHLDMDDKEQIKTALKETGCIMKALLDRLEVLEKKA
ncbi:hypothetical protein McanMca71_006968 [Microsporum canis]|uniref:Uncharacterized protein n=1 Tax=Arthroderma otae (strain ATCC MYA-4605 / CBS 113480) TaxID=554155 RepID=C5FBM1_ARTOC|nr:uncharacterized protein MCYG_00093 [Microsporum canis CBS 113480]EEQ27205.1 predicted protein [Microsporum canis CBS 113480]